MAADLFFLLFGTLTAAFYISAFIYLKAFAPFDCSWRQASVFFIAGSGVIFWLNGNIATFATILGDLGEILVVLGLAIIGVDYFRLIIIQNVDTEKIAAIPGPDPELD